MRVKKLNETSKCKLNYTLDIGTPPSYHCAPLLHGQVSRIRRVLPFVSLNAALLDGNGKFKITNYLKHWFAQLPPREDYSLRNLKLDLEFMKLLANVTVFLHICFPFPVVIMESPDDNLRP